MKSLVPIVLLSLLIVPASAQQVHKCVDAKGNVSYQSQP